MRFIFLILCFVISLNSLAQRRLFGHVICNNPEQSDTTRLKETFIEEMEKGVVFWDDYLKEKKELDSLFSRLSIPDSIKAEVTMALKFFPELHSTTIVFKSARIKGTMNARPSVGNIFRKRDHRKYIVLINNNKGKSKGLNLNDISFNAQVGWFGHEFAHLSTYHEMNNLEIMWFAIKYGISDKFVRKVERYTNKVAVEKGLIFQIFQGEQYILMFNSLVDNYRKRTVYRSLTYKEYICLWNEYRKTHHAAF